MKTEIKLALIGGAVTLVAAVLPVVLGWYGPSSNSKETVVPVPATGVQGAPVSDQQHVSKNPLVPREPASSKPASVAGTGSKLADFAAIIRNRDLNAAKASAEFRAFAKEHYGKEIEQLDRRERVSFWVDMAKSLARQRKLEEPSEK